MPERWERELAKLRVVDVREPVVRERIDRGPRPGLPPRRERLIAGVVAGAVAIAAIAFLWRTFPDTSDPVGEGVREPPILSVSFYDSEVIQEAPDSSYRRVQTAISYGDASEESFTSTTPPDAHVDWIPAEAVTRFVPGPTVGSAIGFQGDGDDPRVLLGRPADWPNFGRFERVERLPDEPGDYILVFVADYPEGIARTARFVQVVEPGVLQLVLRETGDEQALSGNAYVDGRGAEGFLSETSFTEGDAGPLEKAPEAPMFSPEAWLDIEPGSPVMLVTSATTATSGTFDSYDTFVPGTELPNDLLAGAATIEGSGRVLLAVEATWVHPMPGTGEHKTTERALFFFPIEVVAEPTAVQEPIQPTPSPTAEGAVVIDIRRSGGETAGHPSVIAAFAEQEVVLCASGWSLVGPDGTREGGLADCARNDEFAAPAGTPIVLRGDHDSLTVAAHGLEDRTEYGTDEVPAIEPGSVVSYRFDVTWPDGSEASYGLFVTISGPGASSSPDPGNGAEDAAPALRVHCGEQGVEVLTPVVAAQPDGLHVVSVDAPAYWEIGLFPAGEPGSSYWAESDLDDDVFARPVPPGQVGVTCIDHETITSAELERLGAEASPFLLTDPDGLFTPYAPECDVSDQVSYHWELDGVDIDDASDRLRTLPGVRQEDMIQLAGYDRELGSARMWRIVRDGRIVAGLRVGDQGGGGAAGSVCRSSGITGDEL